MTLETLGLHRKRGGRQRKIAAQQRLTPLPERQIRHVACLYTTAEACKQHLVHFTVAFSHARFSTLCCVYSGGVCVVAFHPDA